MKTRNIKKRVTIITVVLSVIVVSAFLVPRYGWKLFGFQFCENPSAIAILDIVVTDDFVGLRGDIYSSAVSYVGYTYNIKGNSLYVGLKYNLLLGFFHRDGSFDIRIPVDKNTIDKVILTGGESEKTVYEKGDT